MFENMQTKRDSKEGKQYHEFVGHYDRDSLLKRFELIKGTEIGRIIDQELNKVGLDLELGGTDYTEEQVREIGSTLGDIHLSMESGDIENVISESKNLANYMKKNIEGHATTQH